MLMAGFPTNTANKKDKRQRQLPKLLLLKSNLQLILAFHHLISNGGIWIFCPPTSLRFWSQDLTELHSHLWPSEMCSMHKRLVSPSSPPPQFPRLLLFASSPYLWEGKVEGGDYNLIIYFYQVCLFMPFKVCPFLLFLQPKSHFCVFQAKTSNLGAEYHSLEKRNAGMCIIANIYLSAPETNIEYSSCLSVEFIQLTSPLSASDFLSIKWM